MKLVLPCILRVWMRADLDSKARVLGHTPGKDSLSAEVQRVADHNAKMRHIDE